MKRLVILCALLALSAPGCKKKPADKDKGDNAAMAAAMEAMGAPMEAMTGDMDAPRKRPAEQPRPADKRTNLDKLKAGFAAYNAGKLDDTVKDFAPDIEWHNVGAPPPYNVLKGPAKVKAYFAMNHKVFPGKDHITRIFDGGDNLVVESVMVAKHAADFMGMKATNKPVGYKVAHWFQLKDGKVVRVHFYSDMRVLMAQVGAMKGPFAKDVTKVMEAPSGDPVVIKGKADPKVMAVNAKLMNLYPNNKDFPKYVHEKMEMVAANLKTLKGIKAAQAMFKKMSKSFVPVKEAAEQELGLGPWWVGRVKETIKRKKDNKEFTVHRLYISKVEDGKLKWGIMYQNFMEVALQLGLMPKPGKAPADKKGAKKGAMKPAKKGK